MSTHDEAKALGDPTRYQLFRYIADAAEPVTVAELTDTVDLGHNAVRRHLVKLVDARLVVERPEDRRRPGRPRLLYSLAPGAAGRWDTDGPYRDLSLLLLEVLRSGASPVEVGRRAGRRATIHLDHGVASFVEEMARRGFSPRVLDGPGDETEVVLETCPFVDAAAADPVLICAVHEGLAQGIAEASSDVEVRGLQVRDPRSAGCKIRLSRSDDA